MNNDDTPRGAAPLPDVIPMTHAESLKINGYTICSPVSGSMRPLIRPHRDSAVFVPAARVKKYDVVLYRRGGLRPASPRGMPSIRHTPGAG